MHNFFEKAYYDRELWTWLEAKAKCSYNDAENSASDPSSSSIDRTPSSLASRISSQSSSGGLSCSKQSNKLLDMVKTWSKRNDGVRMTLLRHEQMQKIGSELHARSQEIRAAQVSAKPYELDEEPPDVVWDTVSKRSEPTEVRDGISEPIQISSFSSPWVEESRAGRRNSPQHSMERVGCEPCSLSGQPLSHDSSDSLSSLGWETERQSLLG